MVEFVCKWKFILQCRVATLCSSRLCGSIVWQTRPACGCKGSTNPCGRTSLFQSCQKRQGALSGMLLANLHLGSCSMHWNKCSLWPSKPCCLQNNFGRKSQAKSLSQTGGAERAKTMPTELPTLHSMEQPSANHSQSSLKPRSSLPPGRHLLAVLLHPHCLRR